MTIVPIGGLGIVRRAVAIATAVLALTPVTASAAVGPVRGSTRVDTRYHVTFKLPGTGWQQVTGAMEGTPALGDYALDTRVLKGPCRITAELTAFESRVRPRIGRKTVSLRPGSRISPTLQYTRHGHHGAVTWWSGTNRKSDAASGGYQRAPETIRSTGRRWIVYDVRVNVKDLGRHTRECASHLLPKAAAVARGIAATMRLSHGAPTPHGPYTISV